MLQPPNDLLLITADRNGDHGRPNATYISASGGDHSLTAPDTPQLLLLGWALEILCHIWSCSPWEGSQDFIWSLLSSQWVLAVILRGMGKDIAVPESLSP